MTDFDTQFHSIRHNVNGTIYPKACAIAREFDLAIWTNSKTRTHKQDPAAWISLLEVDGRESEYRIGFSISISKRDPTMVYIWSLVTDLETGVWNQDIRTVPANELTKNALEVLDRVHGWLQANVGIDPIEAKKKQWGTKYYWKSDDDPCIYLITDFDESSWTGTIMEGAVFDATIEDEHGTLKFETSGNVARDVILTVEREYDKLIASQGEAK